MSLLSWKNQRNLENSLQEFLTDAISTQDLKALDEDGKEKLVQVTVGFQKDESWSLPIISVYVDSKTSDRLSVGSNCRQKEYLIIIDVRALDSGSQTDITEWVEETINDGWTFYDYSPNPASPENPTKVEAGHVAIDFISNVAIRLGEDVDLFDKYRQNITI